MTEKKLSFGFTNKIVKKINVFPSKASVPPTSVQLIDCLESQTIKIKGAVIVEKKPLIIPIQTDDKNLVERVIAAKKLKDRSSKRNEVEIQDNRPDSELSLDEMAARQLIREANSNSSTAVSSKNGSTKVHVVPAVEDTLILEGSKEPTLGDYENVPIGDFGLAMLRGMGWSEQKGIGKDKGSVSVAVPELRPKGMGLGAYKMVQEEIPKEVAVDKDGKELSLVKGAFAKVIAGKEKGMYCKVEGLDDEAGRVIVKMAIKGSSLSLNEFMLCPVTQEEYSASSRILNNSKYRDYQEKEAMSSGQVKSKDRSSTPDQGTRYAKTIKTDVKKNEHEGNIKSRSPSIIKKESKSKDKDIKSRRSTSHDRSKGYDKHTKGRSRSPSYDRKYKEKSQKASRYRSRSRSIERSDTKQSSSKRKQSRRSRSSSSDSPPRSKSKHSKRHRSKSPKKDKDNPKSSTSKRERNSSYSSDEERSYKSKNKESSSKTKVSAQKLEKTRKYSSESDSESNYESQKRDKDRKSVKKFKKDRKSKSSKKNDDSDSSSDDDKKRSYSRRKKKHSSQSDSSDDIRHKEHRSKRR